MKSSEDFPKHFIILWLLLTISGFHLTLQTESLGSSDGITHEFGKHTPLLIRGEPRNKNISHRKTFTHLTNTLWKEFQNKELTSNKLESKRTQSQSTSSKQISPKLNLSSVNKFSTLNSNHKFKNLEHVLRGVPVYKDRRDAYVQKLLKCAQRKSRRCLKKLNYLSLLKLKSRKNHLTNKSAKYTKNIHRFYSPSDVPFRRIPRSLTKRKVLFPSASDRDNDVVPPNNKPTPSLSQPPLSHRDDRKSDAEPEIDDIIHGIMKLLGGNVKITGGEEETKLTTFGDAPHHFAISRSRINDRGPPKLQDFPYMPHIPPDFTRPPIRSPIMPPPHRSRIQGRPPFMANTRPPFLVPFPPSLNAHRVTNRPFLSGVPLPVNVLPNGPNGDREDSIPPADLDPVYSTVLPEEEPSSTSLVEPSANPDFEVDEEIGVESSSIVTLPSRGPVTTDPPITSTPALESISESSKKDTKSTTSSTTENSTKKSMTPDSSSSVLVTSTSKSTLKSIVSTTSLITTIKTLKSKYNPALKSASKSSQSKRTKVRIPSTIPPTEPISTPYSFTGFPTRLPEPIRPFHTTGHPGMVLEDTAYTPGVVITAPPRGQQQGPDIFDVTVSALQGYGTQKTQVPNVYNVGNPLITSASVSSDGSVYIDGRKTYFDLLPNTGSQGLQTVGVGTVIPEDVKGTPFYAGTINPMRPLPPAPPPVMTRRPSHRPPSIVKKPPVRTTRPHKATTLGPPKRIDTCIVGYDTTCKEELGEVCRTEGDVSSCYCKPGTARRRPRTICKKSVVLQLSMKVDKMSDRRIQWDSSYSNPDAMEYQMLSYEAKKALDSAMSQSRGMSNLYLGSFVNKFYSLGGRVIVNATMKLLQTPQTSSMNIRRNLQRQLIKVIQANNNYIGTSALSVDGPLNPIPDVSDVNECFDPNMNDCHELATCSNTFGGFICECNDGFTDRKYDDPDQAGRQCDSCSRDYCSKRGECKIVNGEKACLCDESYYGFRCEIDGEVIGVAVGASVVAVVIIVLTLVFLCMWSRKWKAQDRKTEILSRRPWFFGWRGRGMGGGGGFNVNLQKGNPYGVTIEDRIRWAQMADTMQAHQNVYSQPEQMRPPPQFYPEKRKGGPPPSEYASIGTIHSTYQPHQAQQQFGMQPLNNPFFQHPPLPSKVHSTYGQYGPPSINAASIGGISRAPTLGARTPLPLRDRLGAASVGPFGGASVMRGSKDADAILGAESSEEDLDRSYHLPRPKSRGSVAVGSSHHQEQSRLASSDDIYFEPDDLLTSHSRFPPLPSSPPPPIPHSAPFDNFFRNY